MRQLARAMQDAEDCRWEGSNRSGVLIDSEAHDRPSKACVCTHPAMQYAAHVLTC